MHRLLALPIGYQATACTAHETPARASPGRPIRRRTVRIGRSGPSLAASPPVYRRRPLDARRHAGAVQCSAAGLFRTVRWMGGRRGDLGRLTDETCLGGRESYVGDVPIVGIERNDIIFCPSASLSVSKSPRLSYLGKMTNTMS